MEKKAGIIFDMDNTILSSRIDFAYMRETAVSLLRQWGFLPQDWQGMSTSQLMHVATENGLPLEKGDMIWQKIAEIESEGLHKAVLEDGAEDLLQSLAKDFYLTLLTNNLHAAAEDALKQCGVSSYFSYVAGRGRVPCLKPQAQGVLYVMQQFPTLPASAWLSVGDAWIDAVAAGHAGIAFAAYNNSRKEDWAAKGIVPVLSFQQWDEKAKEALLNWNRSYCQTV